MIDHTSARSLERIIRNLYNLPDRGLASGLADADHFASHPMDAAIMVISYIYARNLEDDDARYANFLREYDLIFRDQNDHIGADTVNKYVNELNKIVRNYL